MVVPALARNAAFVGEQRDRVASLLRGHYERGHSIRALGAATRYSPGRIRRLLEAGTTLHGRGGPRRPR